MPFALTTVALATAMWAYPVHAQSATSNQRNLVVGAAANSPAPKGLRIALVIGNSAYKEAPLANPVNDARAIAKALSDSGFMVIIKENADQRTMQGALRDFGDRLRTSGGTGLFYYAGHGMQIKGRNYLIPVGAALEREDEVAYAALDAQAILDKMESAGNATNIMILDACRNNPFTRSTRSGQAGLAQMDAPLGTLVAYATAPGSVASDGSNGANGLYTEHLLKAMRQPGMKVEDIFKQVRAGVRRDSQGKQIPWESTSLEGDFFFTAPIATPNPQEVIETALWDAVKDSRHAAEVQAYLTRYPQGKYAELAKRQLALLQASPAATKPQTPTPAKYPPPEKTTPSIPAISSNEKRFAYEVGDTWRYEKIEPLENKRSKYTYKVTDVASNGEATILSGTTRRVFDATGQLVQRISDDRTLTYTKGCITQIDTNSNPNLWTFESVICRVDTRWNNGKLGEWAGRGIIEYRGTEKINTPAGEFLAHKFVRSLENPDSKDARREENTYWYVDGLKHWVAQDFKSFNAEETLRIHERSVLAEYSILNKRATDAIGGNVLEAFSFNEGNPGIDLLTLNPNNTEAPLQRPSNAGETNKPATNKPVGTSNTFGFTVGDRWRFQVVDKFKKEVVRNYGRKVTGFATDGSVLVDDGAVRWSPSGAVLVQDYNDGYRDTYEGSYARYPTKLVPGATESVKFSYHWKQPVNYGTEVHDLTMKVVSEEEVVVPAGKFRSWRVEIAGTVSATGNTGSGTGQLKQTCWYVPELLTYAACDRERRFGSKLSNYDRTELTSYTVQQAQSLALNK